MTKHEAINLESECEKLLSDALGMPCIVCDVLGGNIRVIFGENDVSFSKEDLRTTEFIRFRGFYNELTEIVEKIQKVFSEHKDKFRLLLESYRMKFDDDQNYKEVRKVKQCW